MIRTILLFALCLAFFKVSAQTAQDSMAIRKAALDYVEGFFTADTARLARGLSPDLVKRIIDNRSGKSVLNTVGRADLIGYFKTGYKMPDKNPSEPFKAQIDIYDIASDIAIAKVSTNKMSEFFDYIQVGKMNGEWKIINVLWAFNK